uniref:CHK kinase-like domain-containing protein n=1 Tax=Panagrolaimus davidi TaxID=227884 RepID=A0A914PZ42_9BILA
MVTFYDVSRGKGFLSVVLRCTVHFVDSTSPKDVYHSILKIPGLESMKEVHERNNAKNLEGKNENENLEEAAAKLEAAEKNAYATLEERHKSETEFFTIFAPIFDIPCPKIYKIVDLKYGEKEGVIHMEDLTLRGKTITHFENINLTQVKCVIRHLAHMHYKTLIANPKIWRGKFLKNQGTLAKVTGHMDAMINKMIENSKREKDFAPFVEKLSKFYTNKDYAMYSSQQSYIDLGMAPVLVHGDMHSGNIMWKIDEDGNIQNEVAAFVDWQIMHEGSPMSDLARFLTHCCDGVVRRQAEIFAIDYYHECLTKEFGTIEKVPYTLEQLQKAYNYCFLFQAFFSNGVIPMLFGALTAEINVNDGIKNAYYDFAVQKSLHLFEDADKLLKGEMEDIFEKYGT